MSKKNYLWIAIAVMVVVITLILLLIKKDVANNDQGLATLDGKNAYVNNEDANTPPAAVNISPSMVAADALPVAKEVILSIDGSSFSPKTIKVTTGEKAFITFSAKDEARHTFNFIDEDLSFILVVFSKAEGDKSISFNVPKPGTYTYFVDDKANTGKLIVE